MAIAETAAAASIISKLLSMSTDLLERRESREVNEEIRAIQKMLLELQSLGVAFQNENSSLQAQIVSLQTEKSVLHDKFLQLEREKDLLRQQFEEWERKQKNYELAKTEGGAVVYKSIDGTPHYICPSCLERKEIQILQDRRVMSGKFDCPGCSKAFPVKPRTSASMGGVKSHW